MQKTSNDEEEHESFFSHLTCKLENDPRPLALNLPFALDD